jgi:putative NADH-flavin reductase
MFAVERQFSLSSITSQLNWTIIRPPRLIDGAKTGCYRVRDGHLPTGGMSISRRDLADFVINVAESAEHKLKVVGVCN